MSSTASNTTATLQTLSKNFVDHHDVYFTNAYARLYEEKEQGEAETVYYQSPEGKVEYTFLKRPVPFLVDGKQYYDLTTAYGYGGPHIVESTDSKKLMDGFYETFHHYCLQKDIVSEFIRFHLFESEEVKLHFPGKTQLIGHHIARDLKRPLNANFHKSIGRSVRKATRDGVTVSFDASGASLEQFLEIYHQTMDRNDAKDFYYFNDEFFEKLHQALKGHFLYSHAHLDGKIISSFLTIINERYAYGFLGGTLDEYFTYNPATLLEYKTIELLKKKGLKYYVLGGGYRGDDGIYKFKKKFDLAGDHSYYIGKRVHQEDVYQKLVTIRAEQGELNTRSAFFPLYRL